MHRPEKGQWENDNVGYTGNGTVLRISAADGSDYDFGATPFEHIVARYSTGDGNYRGTIDESNFRFYVDLEKEGTIDWNNDDEVNALLADKNHVGIVRMQATGGWGNVYGLRGDVTDTENLNGKHTLYIVYKSNDGANIKSLHFERAAEVVKPTIELGSDTGTSVADGIATVTVSYTVSENLIGKEITVSVNGKDVDTFTPEATNGTVDVKIDITEGVPETGAVYTIGLMAEGMDSPATVDVTIKSSAIEAIEAENTRGVRYFNLNGIEVTNPTAGAVYLKVEGRKATKVLIK